LPQLYSLFAINVVVTRRVAWDPVVAAGERHEEVVDQVA